MNNSYDELQALYREARAEEPPSQADRHAVRAALAAAVSAGIHVATAGASAATVSGSVATTAGSGAAGSVLGVSTVGAKGIISLLMGGKFLSGLLVGAVLGTAVTTTAIVVQPKTTPTTVQRPTEAQQTERRLATPPSMPAETVGAVAPTLPATLAPPVGQAAALLPALASRHHSTATSNFDLSRPIGQDALARETQALAEVQDALSRKDAELAQALLDAQDRQFPSGQLREERAAAKVLALCAASRNEAAEQARAAFITAYPNSPLARRVKMSCEH